MSALIETIRKPLRKILPRSCFDQISQATSYIMGVRAMGFSGFQKLRNLCTDRYQSDGETTSVSIRSLRHPIHVRNGTSDASELIHTIVRRTYEPYTPPMGAPVRLVIDAGANMGDTAAWFLSRYPSSKVVSLEPDSQNFKMLASNVQPYGDRALALNMGLWCRKANLKVVDSESRTALSVVEVSENEPFDCVAISPREILAMTNESVIDLFKIDIEGAEKELFEHEDADFWIAKTKLIMMEIHGDLEMKAVFNALGRHQFEHHTHRELHIFVNKSSLTKNS